MAVGAVVKVRKRSANQAYEYLTSLPDSTTFQQWITSNETDFTWVHKRNSMTNIGKKFYYICNYRIKKGYFKCPAVIYALFPTNGESINGGCNGMVMVYACGQHEHRKLPNIKKEHHNELLDSEAADLANDKMSLAMSGLVKLAPKKTQAKKDLNTNGVTTTGVKRQNSNNGNMEFAGSLSKIRKLNQSMACSSRSNGSGSTASPPNSPNTALLMSLQNQHLLSSGRFTGGIDADEQNSGDLNERCDSTTRQNQLNDENNNLSTRNDQESGDDSGVDKLALNVSMNDTINSVSRGNFDSMEQPQQQASGNNTNTLLQSTCAMLAALTKYQKANNIDKDKLIELVQAQIMSQQNNPLGNLNNKNLQQQQQNTQSYLLAQALANSAQFVTNQIINNGIGVNSNNNNSTSNNNACNNSGNISNNMINNSSKQSVTTNLSPKNSNQVGSGKKLNLKSINTAGDLNPNFSGGVTSVNAGFNNTGQIYPVVTPCNSLNVNFNGNSNSGMFPIMGNIIDPKLAANLNTTNPNQKKILPNNLQQQQQQPCLVSPLLANGQIIDNATNTAIPGMALMLNDLNTTNSANMLKQFNFPPALTNLSPENALMAAAAAAAAAAASSSVNSSPNGSAQKNQQPQKQPFDAFPT
jgi:hypothetical protein